ncbi:MAG: DUF2470 domain-containing protein [Geminicoccaceae bacterium]
MSDHDQDLGAGIRRLMRRLIRVSLGTIDRDSGGPYASLAMVALDHDATPLLLLSDLADHTQNLKRDPRVSLLFDGTVERAVPLTGERATLQGRMVLANEQRLLDRYIARHPDATDYAGFRDFNLYAARIERAHLVAGFGRIHWVPGDVVRLSDDAASALVASEAQIVRHMNQDHADAIQLYAQRLLGRSGEGWVMTGLDPEGADLRRGAETGRVAFERRVTDADGARAELVRLVKKSRAEAAAK